METLDTINCIRTFSGIYIDIMKPEKDMILLEDIAHGLSHVCRYAGQIGNFYSVAQHSVYVSSLLSDKQLQLDALLHDATEAYLQDIPSPIKALLPDYRNVEDRLMKVIAEKYGVQYPFLYRIKWADRALLEFEWNSMIVNKTWKEYWSPEEAKQRFLETYEYLKK